MDDGAGRHVVVGLARARQGWFSELARWSSGAVAPFDFVKCLTAEEARAVLAVGRPTSLLLVDGGLGRWDRDLVDAAREAGAPAVLVEDGRSDRDWEALGCVARLPERFTPDDLLDLLRRHAPSVPSGERPTRVDLDGGPPDGRLVSVSGSGGSGTSTVAMLLAQGLAAPGTGDQDDAGVVLVDGARRSSMALYHDVGDVIPGLPELVDLHRRDRVDPADLRAGSFPTDRRGYRIVLGQRRPRDWVALRPRAVEATLDGLRHTHAWVVVEHDADLEGEAETGSVDVEDRHALARGAVRAAEVVLVVGRPGLHGVHRLVGLLDETCRHGAEPARVVPVVNHAPRSPVDRSELTRAIRDLTAEHRVDGASVAPPVFVPRIRRLEDLHRSAAPLPGPVAARLARAVLAVAAPRARTSRPAAAPAIRPGELGAGLSVRPRDEVA